MELGDGALTAWSRSRTHLLFGATVMRVGDSDALRSETMASGPANVPEFGTVKDSAGFVALHAMDAYQHVRDGTPYPAVLLTTGMNDPRVAPWQAAKMAARLQADGRHLRLPVVDAAWRAAITIELEWRRVLRRAPLSPRQEYARPIRRYGTSPS